MAFNRSLVSGLPEGANVQVIKGVPYVYFRYKWKDKTGKIKYSRDYLGIVDNGRFVPNDYYLRVRPTKKNRPEERWSVEQRREMAVVAVTQQPDAGSGVPATHGSGSGSGNFDIWTKSVGVTSLAASILAENGMIDDVVTLFDGDTVLATRILNIAIGAAITAKPTYLSADESAVQMFLGNQKCPSSPRASEIHAKIGAKLDLSARISQLRIARLRNKPLLALDGSRIECNSDNILDAVVGRTKDGQYASQINYSLLVDASRGDPVGYRYFAGSTNDIATVEDFTHLWNAYGLPDKDPMIVVDRGYYSQEVLIKLGKQGYRFLAGAKTCFKIVKSIIEDRNSEFFEAKRLLESSDFYGLQEDKLLEGQAGKLNVRVSVFRNPVEEMAATRRFMQRLAKFEIEWLDGKADPTNELCYFYDSPKVGEPLQRNMFKISQECYLLGFFAFVTNAGLGLEESLDIYKLRNEAEVVFKLMLSNLMKTTRVHSSQALEGLLFTTFVALSILTGLRARMKADLNGQPISSHYTIGEIFARLKKIQLIEVGGKRYLINVAGRDKKLIEALGFSGLFNSPENAVAPLMKLA